jgi:hypothetical protein
MSSSQLLEEIFFGALILALGWGGVTTGLHMGGFKKSPTLDKLEKVPGFGFLFPFTSLHYDTRGLRALNVELPERTLATFVWLKRASGIVLVVFSVLAPLWMFVEVLFLGDG